MKLDKFVKDFCCNYVRNECIGVKGTKRFNDTDICGPLLKEEPTSCQYFEEVVLPWAIKLDCHEEMVDEYSKVDFGVVARTAKQRKLLKNKVRHKKTRGKKR